MQIHKGNTIPQRGKPLGASGLGHHAFPMHQSPALFWGHSLPDPPALSARAEGLLKQACGQYVRELFKNPSCDPWFSQLSGERKEQIEEKIRQRTRAYCLAHRNEPLIQQVHPSCLIQLGLTDALSCIDKEPTLRDVKAIQDSVWEKVKTQIKGAGLGLGLIELAGYLYGTPAPMLLERGLICFALGAVVIGLYKKYQETRSEPSIQDAFAALEMTYLQNERLL